MIGLLDEPQLAQVRPRAAPGCACRRPPSCRSRRRASRRRTSSVGPSGDPADDPIHLRLEPHVQHPVGLVEHEDLHAVEPDEPAFHEVVQAARGRDQDVRRPDAFRLLTHVRSAVDGHHPKVLRLGDVFEGVADLLGELARRGEHERDGPTFGRGIDLIDDRDREPEGLAGAGLRPRERVSSGGRILDHHDLDRERSLDAARRQRADDLIGYTQIRKVVIGAVSSDEPTARKLDRRARPVVSRHGRPHPSCGTTSPRSSGSTASDPPPRPGRAIRPPRSPPRISSPCCSPTISGPTSTTRRARRTIDSCCRKDTRRPCSTPP